MLSYHPSVFFSEGYTSLSPSESKSRATYQNHLDPNFFGGVLLQLKQWFPTLCNPSVLGLQLPDTTASTASGESFWELQSKNIWITRFGNYRVKVLLRGLCDFTLMG